MVGLFSAVRDQAEAERQFRLIAQRALSRRDGQRLVQQLLGFIEAADLDQRIALSEVRHRRKLQLRHE